MVADFHRLSRESQRVGQTLLDMMRHPLFNVSDIRSETIVHLLRKLERPFAETAVVKLWKEGDGNQRLEFVMRDYLEVFRETMRDPQWSKHFVLTFRAMFDEDGGRLIGPPFTAVFWEKIQNIFGPDVAVGATGLHFDETFMRQNEGMSTSYLAALNPTQAARFQTSSIKLLALLPT